jgi:hypothetical protein
LPSGRHMLPFRIFHRAGSILNGFPGDDQVWMLLRYFSAVYSGGPRNVRFGMPCPGCQGDIDPGFRPAIPVITFIIWNALPEMGFR